MAFFIFFSCGCLSDEWSCFYKAVVKQYAPLDTNYYLQVAFSSLLTFMFPILRAILSAQRLMKKKKKKHWWWKRDIRWLKRYRSICYQTIWMTREGMLRGVGWLEVVNLSFLSPLGVCKFIWVGWLCKTVQKLQLWDYINVCNSVCNELCLVHHSLLPHNVY